MSAGSIVPTLLMNATKPISNSLDLTPGLEPLPNFLQLGFLTLSACKTPALISLPLTIPPQVNSLTTYINSREAIESQQTPQTLKKTLQPTPMTRNFLQAQDP